MKLQLVAKNLKKLKGGPFGDMKKFPKNFFMRFLNSVTVAKNVKGGTLCDFLTSIVLQNIKKIEGGTLWGKNFNPKSFKKSHSSEKKWGFLVWFRGCGRLFCFSFRFGRFWGWSCWGLKLWRLFCWTNEQKVDLSCLKKKTTHCNSRAHFLLKCAD